MLEEGGDLLQFVRKEIIKLLFCCTIIYVYLIPDGKAVFFLNQKLEK